MAWWFSNIFFFAYFAKYIPDEIFNSGGAISYINSSDQILAHGLKSKKKLGSICRRFDQFNEDQIKKVVVDCFEKYDVENTKLISSEDCVKCFKEIFDSKKIPYVNSTDKESVVDYIERQKNYKFSEVF